MTSEIAPVILLPNPPPVYSLTTTTFSGRDADPSRDAEDGLSGALRAGVDVDLAVLPVRHHGPGLQRLVAGVGRDERFVEHERGILEARLEVTVRPLLGRIRHHRQAARVGFSQLRRGPLQPRGFRDGADSAAGPPAGAGGRAAG